MGKYMIKGKRATDVLSLKIMLYSHHEKGAGNLSNNRQNDLLFHEKIT